MYGLISAVVRYTWAYPNLVYIESMFHLLEAPMHGGYLEDNSLSHLAEFVYEVFYLRLGNRSRCERINYAPSNLHWRNKACFRPDGKNNKPGYVLKNVPQLSGLEYFQKALSLVGVSSKLNGQSNRFERPL